MKSIFDAIKGIKGCLRLGRDRAQQRALWGPGCQLSVLTFFSFFHVHKNISKISMYNQNNCCLKKWPESFHFDFRCTTIWSELQSSHSMHAQKSKIHIELNW